MRSETQQAGRRRRGGRRHRGPRTEGPRSQHSSQGSSSSPAKKAAKPGFFQRLLAFFTGKPKKAPEVPGNVYGRVLGSNEPNGSSSSRSNGNGRKESQNNDNGQNRKPASEPRPAKPARKPELTEVTSPKLYVGNLSFDATESDLGELFAGVGSVQNSEVVSHRETQKSKGFAFVTLATVDEAKRAVVELHDKEFMGRRLVVSGAKTNDVREVRDARNVE
jgi:hypothetical protein